MDNISTSGIILAEGVKRRLLRKTADGHMAREEDATSCTQAWLSARARSGSPSKRLRKEFGQQEACDLEGFEGTSDDEEQPRGRKRSRSSLDRTLPLSQSSEGGWQYSGSELSESVESILLESLKT